MPTHLHENHPPGRSHGPATKLATALAIGTALTFTAACGPGGGGHGTTAEAKSLITSCAGPVHSYVALDGTASQGVGTLDKDRTRAVHGAVSRVAACGGSVKIVAFSSSSAATTTLYEGGVPVHGATDQARARRLDGAATEVVSDVRDAYEVALPFLDPTGSDPVAQLRLFGEWAQQKGSGDARFLALTDGVQTMGVSPAEIAADPEAAAAKFRAPDLSGLSVTFAGIGEVAGAAPSTDVVDALKAFYTALCERTKAATCTVVSAIAGASS